ncbi:hypothetical protein [Salinicoccus halodurans]|uniref:Glutamate--cysteine ligase/cyanophycin synthetase n=1 Tax=Salinicoccus halodurans TaxID=407035 RepID=A0A0F7HJA5_9STAP|nr:hypothetical protein [Salinicoccus halodurans]AKG73428.1 hypothetical protein AAT16_03865 [Salinicoccus halodurans]SFK50378.1 glutamate--cysteine ligase/cyanophycin synthetase [Salinicoccus halodurans]
MNEKILAEFFEKTKEDESLEYPKDIEIDLLNVAEDELKRLEIPFERVTNKKNTLRLYNTSNSPLRYVKGFYPNNTNLGKLICKDKFLTQRFLDYAKIKTPIGKMFKPNDLSKAKEFVRKSPEKKFVLKPVSMSMSLGTFLGVNSENLEKCWNESFQVQKKYKVDVPRVLIQEQIEGLEIRIIVVEGEVGTAIFRGPGNVVGDGIHTIEELINEKNSERKKHNYLNRNLLKINDNLLNNLSNRGLTLDSVLPEGEYCVLYSQSNIATGREVFEVSKYLNPHIFEQVLDAVTAIPGVHTAGVDIFIENLDAKEGTIIEVNLNPAFQLHYYPMIGKPSTPLYDVFKYNKIDRKILNDDLNFDSLTQEEFELVIERFKFLYNKQKKLSNAFNSFLKLY